MLFQPQDFRGGEAGQHGVAECRDGFPRTAELLHDLAALGGGGGVTPQLGGTDDLVLLVEWDKSMLLPADADRLHVIRLRNFEP